jgi:hypothetical protein
MFVSQGKWELNKTQTLRVAANNYNVLGMHTLESVGVILGQGDALQATPHNDGANVSNLVVGISGIGGSNLHHPSYLVPQIP